MRVALLADIHGNLPALDAVLQDIDRHGPFDQIVVAGDLAWAGPWPAEVVDRVRGLGCPVIQGNTDAFFRHEPDDPPDDKDSGRFAAQMSWMLAQIGPQRSAYLAGLPFAQRIPAPEPGHDLLVVHANPHDYDQALPPELADDELDLVLGSPAACDWAALAFGHLHIPYHRDWHGHLLIDIGSAGLPMDGDRRAAWTSVTWEAGWQAEHHRVAYDVDRVVQRMHGCGMPRGKHFAERLLRASYGM